VSILRIHLRIHAVYRFHFDRYSQIARFTMRKSPQKTFPADLPDMVSFRPWGTRTSDVLPSISPTRAIENFYIRIVFRVLLERGECPGVGSKA